MEELSCKLAENEMELAGAMDVRRQVFVREQGISEDLVYDSHDGILSVLSKFLSISTNCDLFM